MVNRQRYFASLNMHRNGRTSNRPEQLLFAEILQKLFQKSAVRTEVRLSPILRSVGGVMPRPGWRFDILVLPQKWVFRLMGPPHERNPQRAKDDNQKLVLEGNGYTVFDIWYDKFPNLWKLNDNSLQEVRQFLAENKLL